VSRVKVNWLGDYRTEIEVRGIHHLQGDEAPEYGGQDTGPMPTDYLLVAVGTCMLIQADLPPDQLEPLVEQARRVCFVSNTLAAACPVSVVAETINK
jgi:uncharacterized OsmC-like protein